MNALGLKPGDVINIQDPDINDVVASGRVTTSSASTTTVIKTDRDLTSYLNSNDTFKLHLIYPSGGAYLTQPRATINSTNYVQGDLILLDEDGNAIDTHAKASNLKDDSGAVVQTFWSDDVRVETQTVSSFNTTSVTVSSAFKLCQYICTFITCPYLGSKNPGHVVNLVSLLYDTGSCSNIHSSSISKRQGVSSFTIVASCLCGHSIIGFDW